jgi:hypothetical protein
MNPDPTLFRMFGFDVPAQSVWDTLETIVSGTAVAFAAFWLARRRFKTERWHERRGEIYGKLNALLFKLERATKPLAVDEDRRASNWRPLLSPERHQEVLDEAHLAEAQLEETFAEHRYLLSPRAVQILDDFFRALGSEELTDSSQPVTVWHEWAKQTYRAFSERLQVDVGPQLGIAWGVCRIGEGLARARWNAGNRAGLFRLRLRSWWNNRGRRRG